MNIYLQTQGFALTPAIEAHVRKQLCQQLAKSEDRIVAVHVFLSDVNGPRGGEDKKVLIRIQLPARMLVKVESVHTDLYAAVSVTARQARRTVKRTLRKYERVDRAMLRRLRHFPDELPAS